MLKFLREKKSIISIVFVKSEPIISFNPDIQSLQSVMVTSSHGDAFHITGPVWGKSAGHHCIPLTKGQWFGALVSTLLLVWTSI